MVFINVKCIYIKNEANFANVVLWRKGVTLHVPYVNGAEVRMESVTMAKLVIEVFQGL